MGFQAFGRVCGQKWRQLVKVMKVTVEPERKFIEMQYDRHSIVDWCNGRIRCGGQDRETFQRLPFR